MTSTSIPYPIAPKTDDPKIVNTYISAIKGDSEAQYQIGKLNATNRDAVSDREADQWLAISAENGHKDAMLLLACNLLDKNRYCYNFKKSCYYLEMAKRNGHEEAPALLEIIEIFHLIDLESLMAVLMLMKKVSDPDPAIMALKMGKELELTEGDESRFRIIFLLYSAASDCGNTEAMMRTGDMLENGMGVKQSLKKAHAYYNRAYKLGNIQASAKLESIKMKMTRRTFH